MNSVILQIVQWLPVVVTVFAPYFIIRLNKKIKVMNNMIDNLLSIGEFQNNIINVLETEVLICLKNKKL